MHVARVYVHMHVYMHVASMHLGEHGGVWGSFLGVASMHMCILGCSSPPDMGCWFGFGRLELVQDGFSLCSMVQYCSALFVLVLACLSVLFVLLRVLTGLLLRPEPKGCLSASCARLERGRSKSSCACCVHVCMHGYACYVGLCHVELCHVVRCACRVRVGVREGDESEQEQ